MKIYEPEIGELKFSSSDPIKLFEDAIQQVNLYKNRNQPELTLMNSNGTLKIRTSHLPRNYRAELVGKLIKSDEVENLLEYKIKPTRFSKIITSIWLYGLILMLLTPIVLVFPNFHWVFLLIEGFGLLIMLIGVTFSKSGYRKEVDRIRIVLEKIERY